MKITQEKDLEKNDALRLIKIEFFEKYPERPKENKTRKIYLQKKAEIIRNIHVFTNNIFSSKNKESLESGQNNPALAVEDKIQPQAKFKIADNFKV